MWNRIFNMALGRMIQHYLRVMLEARIRKGSIQAVKTYVMAVKYARYAFMGLFGVGVWASVFVVGLLLVVLGIVGLLPIEARSMAITTLVIGVIFTLVAGVGILVAFNQKRWLEMSKSYELMDAVLAPWPGVLPPNPIDVVKTRATSGMRTKRSGPSADSMDASESSLQEERSRASMNAAMVPQV